MATTKGGPVRVLIADAREDVREALSALLESTEDFVVVGEAASADEAFHQAASLSPDLLVIDPEGHHDTAGFMKLTRKPYALVVLTLNASADCRAKARRLGIDAVVDKGVTPEDLLTTFRTCCAPRLPS